MLISRINFVIRNREDFLKKLFLGIKLWSSYTYRTWSCWIPLEREREAHSKISANIFMMIKKILASGSNLKLWHEYFPWPGGVEKFSRVAKFFGRNVHPLMANIVLKSHCSRGRLSTLTVVKYQGVALRKR